MKRFVIVLVLACSFGCASAPPALSSAGVVAFRSTQVIQALDVFRDAAIAANALTPPLVSTETTRKVVTYHKAAITTAHAAPAGWAVTVQTGLDQVQAQLSAPEHVQLDPYIALTKALIAEVK